jgi:hypothetical protein
MDEELRFVDRDIRELIPEEDLRLWPAVVLTVFELDLFLEG